MGFSYTLAFHQKLVFHFIRATFFLRTVGLAREKGVARMCYNTISCVQETEHRSVTPLPRRSLFSPASSIADADP